MSGDNYPTCEKSGLLISRCRCPQHRIPRRRLHTYMCRRPRMRFNRRRYAYLAGQASQREWMQDVWKRHAAQYPEMWSEGYGRDN